MDPAAIAIHKPATLGLGTESRCRPRRPTRITKEKKVHFFFDLQGCRFLPFLLRFWLFFGYQLPLRPPKKHIFGSRLPHANGFNSLNL